MGHVSDRIGRRIPIILGCLISGLALLAIPFVSDFVVLMILAVTYGFGFATVTASTSPLISELVSMKRVGTSIGFLAMTMDVGQTLGPIISGMILATSLQYLGVFALLGLVVLFSCAVFALSGVAKTSLNRAV
jgi:MFS family permease